MKQQSIRRSLINSILIAGLFCSSNPAFAEKMDMDTHSLLIQKLELVIKRGSPTDSSTTEIRLRTADLLAERARLHILEAQGKVTKEIKEDRKRALVHYTSAVDQTNPERRALVLLQMAHLHLSLGDSAKAIAILERIVKEGTKVYPVVSVGNAFTQWGDILFSKAEYSKALSKFESAYRFVGIDKKGYVTYRIAWCQLNLGKTEVATARLIQLLRTPELFTDSAFHEDVARDLVSFIARGDVTRDRVELLLSLSPNNIQRENLKSLAAETERLGKKRESIFVWSMILSDEPSAAEGFDGRVRMAILEWSLNRKAATVEQMKLAAEAKKDDGCGKEDECAASQKRMRKLVTDWNRQEGEQVSNEILAAYAVYNATFTEEADMHLWAAQVARLLKRYEESANLYRRSSVLAAKSLGGKKEDADLRKMFNTALVAQIEMAEASEKPQAKELAYNHYLDLAPKGERALEVRYQRAHLYYDAKKTELAASEFRAIALSGDKSREDLKKKSADLALDSLVLIKQEDKIEGWALEFANAVPAGRKEYLGIARRAVLKEVNAISENPKSSESDIKRASARLSAVNLEGTSESERRLIVKNQLILAVRTRDLAETDKAAERFLKTTGISDADREFALEKKVWAAEMRLDFSTAYALTTKMEMKKTSETDRQLRLAYLAELAGRNPMAHYKKVIAGSNSKAKSTLAATRLIRLAKNPWAELKAYESLLKQNRENFANLVLEVYGRTGSVSKIQEYLKQPSVRRTNAGLTLSRVFEVRDINAFDKKIASHRMISASDRLLQESLKKRLALLKEADQIAQKTIRSGDTTLQTMTLTIAARENARLFSEILKLPVPRKLKAEQKKQYQDALAQQAAPFSVKADEINKKLAEFWNNGKVIDGMISDIKTSRTVVAKVYADEIRELAKRASSSQRSSIESDVKSALQSRPSQDDVISARRNLARDPFSVSAAKSLQKLEAELDRDAMVAYLDARLGQLQGGKL